MPDAKPTTSAGQNDGHSGSDPGSTGRPGSVMGRGSTLTGGAVGTIRLSFSRMLPISARDSTTVWPAVPAEAAAESSRDIARRSAS